METIIIPNNDTCLKILFERILEAKKLGLNQININILLNYILEFKNLEMNLMISCFMDGREFQADKNNINIGFQDSADNYFKENWSY